MFSSFKALYGVQPKVGAPPILQPSTPITVSELVEYRELHLQSLKQHLANPQNRMKNMADKKHSNLQFQAGDKGLTQITTLHSSQQTLP